MFGADFGVDKSQSSDTKDENVSFKFYISLNCKNLSFYMFFHIYGMATGKLFFLNY